METGKGVERSVGVWVVSGMGVPWWVGVGVGGPFKMHARGSD